ncbi:hypothetical protein RhiirC2_835706, partial [Rhizophagus irregularis]
KIRLTRETEEILLKGGSNIAITRNDRTYFFRMFDVKLNATAIKKRYEWQAYKKIDNVDDLKKKDEEIIKEYIKIFGGHFAKIIKINKIKYILMYFNNENELLKRFIGPRWKTIWEKAFKIKGQDELIGEEGVYKKRFGINRVKRKRKSGGDNKGRRRQD